MSTVHVLPVNDRIEHDGDSDDCICGPDIEYVEGGGKLVKHHALDGREFAERGEQLPGGRTMNLDVPVRGDLVKALQEVRRAYGYYGAFEVAHDDGCPSLETAQDGDCTCEVVWVKEKPGAA